MKNQFLNVACFDDNIHDARINILNSLSAIFCDDFNVGSFVYKQELGTWIFENTQEAKLIELPEDIIKEKIEINGVNVKELFDHVDDFELPNAFSGVTIRFYFSHKVPKDNDATFSDYFKKYAMQMWEFFTNDEILNFDLVLLDNSWSKATRFEKDYLNKLYDLFPGEKRFIDECLSDNNGIITLHRFGESLLYFSSVYKPRQSPLPKVIYTSNKFTLRTQRKLAEISCWEAILKENENELWNAILRAYSQRSFYGRLDNSNQIIKSRVDRFEERFDLIVGNIEKGFEGRSDVMQSFFQNLVNFSPSDLNLVIVSEIGMIKEAHEFARLVHQTSGRQSKSFESVDLQFMGGLNEIDKHIIKAKDGTLHLVCNSGTSVELLRKILDSLKKDDDLAFSKKLRRENVRLIISWSPVQNDISEQDNSIDFPELKEQFSKFLEGQQRNFSIMSVPMISERSKEEQLSLVNLHFENIKGNMPSFSGLTLGIESLEKLLSLLKPLNISHIDLVIHELFKQSIDSKVVSVKEVEDAIETSGAESHDKYFDHERFFQRIAELAPRRGSTQRIIFDLLLNKYPAPCPRGDILTALESRNTEDSDYLLANKISALKVKFEEKGITISQPEINDTNGGTTTGYCIGPA